MDDTIFCGMGDILDGELPGLPPDRWIKMWQPWFWITNSPPGDFPWPRYESMVRRNRLSRIVRIGNGWCFDPKIPGTA
jgi:hypothetical protein